MSNSKTADTNLEEKSFIHYFPHSPGRCADLRRTIRNP